jgi:hypothetical protein
MHDTNYVMLDCSGRIHHSQLELHRESILVCINLKTCKVEVAWFYYSKVVAMRPKAIRNSAKFHSLIIKISWSLMLVSRLFPFLLYLLLEDVLEPELC